MVNQSSTNSGLGTILKWELCGLITWNLLRPEVRDGILEFLSDEIAAYNQRQAEIARQQRIQEIWAEFVAELEESIKSWIPSSISIASLAGSENPLDSTLPSLTISSSNLLSEHLERNAAWFTKILHPSVVIILGKRGSGKSALGYLLLELLRFVADIYVLGIPEQARSLLPEWIGIVPSLDDLPNKCIALVDEAIYPTIPEAA